MPRIIRPIISQLENAKENDTRKCKQHFDSLGPIEHENSEIPSEIEFTQSKLRNVSK
jgi:hypothetical protein